MNNVLRALLKEFGVEEYRGAPIATGNFSDEDIEELYQEAFQGDESVVVVVAGFDDAFIVKSATQIAQERRRFTGYGGQMVLRIPKDVWSKITSTFLESGRINDLTTTVTV